MLVQDSPSRKQDQYIVRFPDGMRDRLKEAAADNGRSLNAEIVQRLDASFIDAGFAYEPSVLSEKVADAAFVRGVQIGLVEAIFMSDDPLGELRSIRERLRKPLSIEQMTVKSV